MQVEIETKIECIYVHITFWSGLAHSASFSILCVTQLLQTFLLPRHARTFSFSQRPKRDNAACADGLHHGIAVSRVA